MLARAKDSSERGQTITMLARAKYSSERCQTLLLCWIRAKDSTKREVRLCYYAGLEPNILLRERSDSVTMLA